MFREQICQIQHHLVLDETDVAGGVVDPVSAGVGVIPSSNNETNLGFPGLLRHTLPCEFYTSGLHHVGIDL